VTSFHIEKLVPQHDVTAFDCGELALNQYLSAFALQNQRSNAAQTYVALHGGDVAGFHTLVVGHIEYDDTPERMKKGLARHPVPVIILARLATDRRWQGRGVGIGLLKDAIIRTLLVADIAGARALVVHAKNDRAREYYLRLGFVAGFRNSMHLYCLTKELRKLGQN
jgi:GNAT superfamily N-acetyltransferase